MTTTINDDDFYDEQGILVVDHLVIKDVGTQEILVNQQGSTTNLNFEDNNED